ncbi:hypothetical protein PIROE2DRAFT_20970 [Piromyces sp. E2]|nr:hypothetical protein PIROE2DRAFT_20970 [Piromyces sp. E2]|eukprot:OUM61278.1 hypothetical protein PIROE2DRAFT_20970 [Piromyces sp. E2]
MDYNNNKRRNEEFGINIEEFNKENINVPSKRYSDEEDLITKTQKDNNENKKVNRSFSRSFSRNSTFFTPPERRKSYQNRAMFRKTLAYQKRQIGTNLCCVGACPTIMIIMAFLLSLMLEHFLTKDVETQNIEYCTRDFNGTFVLPGAPDGIKSDDPNVKIKHYSSKYNPCSIWYGSNDHIASSPYDIVPEGNEANINRDTVFYPPVSKSGNYPYLLQKLSQIMSVNTGGAASPSVGTTPASQNGDATTSPDATPNGAQNVQNAQNAQNVQNEASPEATQNTEGENDTLRKRQSQSVADLKSAFFGDPAISYIIQGITRPWGIVAVNKGNSTERALIGECPAGPRDLNMATVNMDQPANTTSGYLGNTSTRYGLNMYDLMYSGSPSISFERLPYYEVVEVENEKELDDYITKRIKIVTKILANTTFDKYTEEDKKYIDLSAFKDTNDAIIKSIDYMPYGIMYYKDIDEQNLNYDINLSVGENEKLNKMFTCEQCEVSPYMSYPGKGKRLLYFLTEFSNSVIRKITNNKMTITQGFRFFPESETTGKKVDLGSVIESILYPWGVSFLIPIFVISLVKEKEERYLVMMNMNGMKSSTYYFFTYLTNLVLSIISMTLFAIVGFLCGMATFRETSIVMLVIEFFVWSNLIVIMSFFFSIFFKRNGSALVASFLIVLLGIVLTFCMIENLDNTNMYFVYPPSAFYYVLFKFSELANSKTLPSYKLTNFVPGDRVFTATMFMIADYLVLCVLTLYFKAVVPQEYGSHKPWHLNFYRCFRSKKSPYDTYSGDVSKMNPFYTEKEAQAAERLEDDDVKAERKRVLSGKYDPKCPLVVKNVRKEYAPREKGGDPHVAVHSVTFAVEEGVVFGLLGPNGAGKTTLINSLIGVYTPTSGYARLAGFNIETDMDQVYKRIGICPQHDILWNDLTVEEHLLFYARLKGISKNEEKDSVLQSLESVGLEEKKSTKVKGLSGGEKRRLSIAIALVGDPKLIFLDEPTTGLDPDVRRLIWSILNDISSNRTIMITTHSMEEAEVLCHRIGIMSHGTLRCCNTQLRLKELYGAGFKLTYSNKPEKYRELKEFINSIIPAEHKVVRDLASNSVYEFIPTPGLISHLFEIIDHNKERFGIIDWGISQSSLEEVFLSIISDDDANAS